MLEKNIRVYITGSIGDIIIMYVYLNTFMVNYELVSQLLVGVVLCYTLLETSGNLHFKGFCNHPTNYLVYCLLCLTIFNIYVELFYLQSVEEELIFFNTFGHSSYLDEYRLAKLDMFEPCTPIEGEVISCSSLDPNAHWYSSVQSAPYFNLYGSLICLLGNITVLVSTHFLGVSVMANFQLRMYVGFFLVITNTITNTQNLITLYLSFEMLFLPTLIILYHTGFINTTTDSLNNLIIWTLAGIFFVFICLAYLYSQHGSVSMDQIAFSELTPIELMCIYIFLFLGFSVNIPVIPFHLWLLNIHIDAPVSLSLFLSGFLVKLSLYCFYTIHNALSSVFLGYCVVGVVFVGIGIASISFYALQDIKRLIAWITIQEMSIMLFLVLIRNSTHLQILFLFIFFHGILSMFMFYIVDLVEQRYSTREFTNLSGLQEQVPKLSQYIWVVALIFCSFPLTFNFVLELEFFGSIIELYSYPLLYLCLFINLLALVGVSNLFFGLLFGSPHLRSHYPDISNIESSFLNVFLFLLQLTLFILYNTL